MDDVADIDKLFEETVEVTRALRRGVRQALIEHKLLGYPVSVMQGDKVVWIAPEDIEIPPEP